MSNRAIKIDYSNPRNSDTTSLKIQFFNDNNEIIPAQSDTVNDKLNEITVTGIVNIPEGATYFMLYNLSTSNSYNPYIYNISYFEYDTLPNPVSNITSSFDHVSITLKWDNPKDSDFNKVAIYRNGIFIGYSTTNTYIDTLLQANTEYTYTIQTIDNNNNRGKEYVVHKAKTLRNLEDNFTKINLSGGVNTSAVYTAPNGVVVTSNASNYNNGSAYYLAYLFDGKNIYNDGSTYWLTNSTGNRFLTVDFLNERNIKGIAIEPKSREDATSNFRIFASNDNSNWTQLTDWYNTSRETANNTKVQYLLDVSYRYYRLELTRNENWGVCLGELTFYE